MAREADVFTRAKENKLYEEVVRQVIGLIEAGELKDGDLLPAEADMAKSFGVSRATIREGLRILGIMGFVETRRGKGTVVQTARVDRFKEKLNAVAKKNRKDLQYIYEFDKMLEPAIARLAAEKAEEDDIKKLKQALSSLEKALLAGESGGEESLYFHRCIVESVKNPIIKMVFELTKSFQEWRSFDLVTMAPKETMKEYYKVYDAIRRGDSHLASRAMEEHLDRDTKDFSKFLNL